MKPGLEEIVIGYRANAGTVMCSFCARPFMQRVGSVTMLRSNCAPVCMWCAEQHHPKVGAIAYAGGRWYRSYVTGRLETLTLWDALNAYSGGQWQVADAGVWSTDDLVEGYDLGDGIPPLLDLEQPVLWIGNAVFAGCSARQVDTTPLVTLVAPRQGRGHLDILLAQDGQQHRWVAPNGVCWRADVLREQLTRRFQGRVQGREVDLVPDLADAHGASMLLEGVRAPQGNCSGGL